MQLPKFFAVQQKFVRPQVADITSEVAEQFDALRINWSRFEGKRLAVTAGSRGIADIPCVFAAVVSYLKSKLAKPFVIPAMGSHGGATDAGQLELLGSLGMTEKVLGCPIVSSMDTMEVATAEGGFPVNVSRDAMECDGVVVVNRVKPHTRFDGEIESGLIKMLMIGLGKHAGAKIYHRVLNHGDFQAIAKSIAPVVIKQANVIAGLAIVENAFEEIAELHAIRGEQIVQQEPKVLQRAKELLPRLPFLKADLVVVDEIGKDISGTGMDTNVVGRKFNDRVAMANETPRVHTLYVRRLTPKAGGNASGIGIADMCHKQLADAINLHKTYVNSITAGHLSAAMMPTAFESDFAAFDAAMQLTPWRPSESNSDSTIAWIENTKRLEWLICSEAFRGRLEATSALADDLVECGLSKPLEFDEAGNLKSFEEQLRTMRGF